MTDTELIEMALAKLERLEGRVEVILGALAGATGVRMTATEVRASGGRAGGSSLTGDPRLSEVIDAYVKIKVSEVSSQHLAILGQTLELFKRTVWGKYPLIDMVDRACMVEYRAGMVARGRANKTVNNHLAIISAFFEFAVTCAYVNANPAKGLKIRNKSRAQNERKAFTPEQMKQVVGPRAEACHQYIRLHHPAQHWLPVIMAYTGARPEEVCQLRVGDIRQEGEGWIFDFASLDEGLRRKNESSRRFVPIHPKLFKLGLLQLKLLAEQQGTVGFTTPLFPELTGERRASSPSRWFNRRLRSEHLIMEPKLTLYSIRHAVITQLKHAGEPSSMIAQLVGHSDPSMTTGRYGKDYPLEQLTAVVAHLDWGF